MKHLRASFEGRNQFWRFIIMFVAVLAANMVGTIPLMLPFFRDGVADPVIREEFTRNLDPAILGVEKTMGLIYILLPFLVMFLAFALLIKPLHGRTFMQTVNGNSRFRFGRMLSGALIWTLLSLIYMAVEMSIFPDSFTLNNLSSSLLPLIGVVVLMIPFQAGFEELIMRGYLMQGFFRMFPRKWFTLIVTAVIFALMHFANPEVEEYGFFTTMPQYLLFGLVFGIIAILDDGIEMAIGAHAANNIIISILVTNSSSALQTSAVFEQTQLYPWFDFWALLLMSAAFILIMGRKYKWQFLQLLK